MRQRLIGLVLTAACGFSVGGCGSNNKPPTTTAMDMTATAMPKDMSMAPLTCLGLGGCILDCLNAGGPAGSTDMAGSPLQGCLDMCAPMTTQKVVIDWINAFNCGIDFCYGVADASVAQCVGQAQDPPGSAGGTCTTCIYNAPFLVLGDFSDPNVPVAPTGICPKANSPDCKGGNECMTKFNTCINQM